MAIILFQLQSELTVRYTVPVLGPGNRTIVLKSRYMLIHVIQW